VTVGLDSVRQAREIPICEQFAPALEIERGLSFGGIELDRQRHSKSLFYRYEQGKLLAGNTMILQDPCLDHIAGPLALSLLRAGPEL
jgi:hypothetical protein